MYQSQYVFILIFGSEIVTNIMKTIKIFLRIASDHYGWLGLEKKFRKEGSFVQFELKLTKM